MSRPAIRVEKLSKCYRLGETHEHTLSDRLVRAAGRLLGRKSHSAKLASEDFWALRDIDLTINEGEAVGIIGSNGAGKSTLLKILSRITPPTSGRALVRGRLSSLLEVGTGFHPELTGRENVFLNGAILGMRRAEVTRKFDEIVVFAGVEKFIDTPVKRYSSGMYVRLAFAVAAHLEPDVLIIDEVLAVGDAEFQKRCLGKMSDVVNEGRTVVFVSHNMAAVQNLCTRAVWIMDGKIQLNGDVADCIAAHLGVSCSSASSISFERTNPRFWLKGIELKNPKGALSSDFTFDQSVAVVMHYAQSIDIAGLSLGIRVRTAQGIAVFSSERPIESLGQLTKGEYSCLVEIPAGFLVPGKFMLTVGVHVPSVEVVLLHENVLSFEIHETGSALARYFQRDIGCVIANCTWSDLSSTSMERWG